MSTIKNFGIAGVSSDVQLGKQGGRFVYDSNNSVFKMTASDGSTLSTIKIADGVEADDAATKSQLDAVSSTASSIQSELDTTQTGAGLGTGGTYTADGTSNYITGATSLANADSLLDDQIKINSDNIGSLGTLTTTATSDLVSAINELDGEIGDLSTLTTTDKSTLVAAINELDAATSGDTTALQNELDATQAGAGLNTDGTYTADAGSNYLTGATDLYNADSLLDAQIATNAADIAGKVDAAGDTMTGNLAMSAGTYIILNESPTQDTHAVNRAYVDSRLAGLNWKDSVRAAADSNIDLTGGTFGGTIDGVTLSDGDRVLVFGQTTASENGIYVYASGTATFSRASDADTIDELVNATVFVEEGTSYGDVGYTCTNDSGDTLGTTDITFVQFNGAANITAGIGLAKSGNTLSVNLGAGVAESPTDEVGLDLYSSGALFLTEDGTTSSTATGAQLAIKLDGTTLTRTASGLKVSDAEIQRITDLETEMTATQTAAGLNADGTFAAHSGTNYIDGGTSMFNVDELLDTQIATNATNISTNTGNIGTMGSLTTTETGSLVGAINEIDAELEFFDFTGVTSVDGEYIKADTVVGEVTLTAKNASGTGDVDLVLSGQGNGEVIIAPNASSQGLIIADDDTSLTVSGGDAVAADAGDMFVQGGNGTSTFASGDVILQGGTGGSAEGITIIRDSAGDEVATFENGIASATDYLSVQNGIGDVTLEAKGDSTNVDLVLTPKGTGLVVGPTGYDVTGGADEALANKGYVDSQVTEVANNVDPLIMRQSIAADSTNSTFTIGTMNNVAGKTYYVSRITLHVTTAFSGNSVDNMLVSDGTTTLAAKDESDIATGTYVVELPFATATAGGATVDVEFYDAGDVAAVPTAGNMIAVVEYKVL